MIFLSVTIEFSAAALCKRPCFHTLDIHGTGPMINGNYHRLLRKKPSGLLMLFKRFFYPKPTRVIFLGIWEKPSGSIHRALISSLQAKRKQQACDKEHCRCRFGYGRRPVVQ